MKCHTYIFDDGSDSGVQIGVELWETGEVTVMVREDSSSIWGPKVRLLSEEGHPVQIAFEQEAEQQRCGCPLDYHLADCPLLTDRYATSALEMYGPNGPDEDFDPGEDEEAEREFEQDRAEHETMYYKEVTGK